MVLELGWLGLIGLILAVIIIYTFILLITYKKVMDTQKGRYLFSIPIAPFSIKSRINAIKNQLGVEEENIDYIGKGLFEVKDDIVEVGSFFGVVARKVDEDGKEIGVYDSDAMKFNLPNLKVENIKNKDNNNNNGKEKEGMGKGKVNNKRNRNNQEGVKTVVRIKKGDE